MDYRSAVPLLLLASGLFLVISELSGFTIVSQTCCFPPNCDPENICRQPGNPAPQRNYLHSYVGGFLVAVSILTYMFYIGKSKG